MTQDAQAFNVSAAFNLAHVFTLELHQSRMCQIERNRKSRHPIRREPFSRQPDVRLETNAAIVQFTIETFDMRLDERTLDANRQIANARVE